jgi:hypothetical protein
MLVDTVSATLFNCANLSCEGSGGLSTLSFAGGFDRVGEPIMKSEAEHVEAAEVACATSSGATMTMTNAKPSR